jgi:hypothetical protein
MCLSRDVYATLALVEKLVARGWTRRAAWEKAASWQRMTLNSERARRAQARRDAAYAEMALDLPVPPDPWEQRI